MKLKRLDHVGVIVANLDRARKLIEDSFGMEPIRHVKRDDLEATFFHCEGADIELSEIKDPAMREQRLGTGREARVEHIAFEVENLNEILAALEGLGIKTTGPPQVSPAYTTVWTEANTSGDVMYQFMERPHTQTPD
jgi:catechol 2,3-dioxygenase-like lactoylglutathione lyase family enzyme